MAAWRSLVLLPPQPHLPERGGRSLEGSIPSTRARRAPETSSGNARSPATRGFSKYAEEDSNPPPTKCGPGRQPCHPGDRGCHGRCCFQRKRKCASPSASGLRRRPAVAVRVCALQAHLALDSTRRPRGGPLRPWQAPLTQPRQSCVAPGNPTRAGHRGLLGKWLVATLRPRTHAPQADCCFDGTGACGSRTARGDDGWAGPMAWRLCESPL
jgi:hypothetical protein